MCLLLLKSLHQCLAVQFVVQIMHERHCSTVLYILRYTVPRALCNWSPWLLCRACALWQDRCNIYCSGEATPRGQSSRVVPMAMWCQGYWTRSYQGLRGSSSFPFFRLAALNTGQYEDEFHVWSATWQLILHVRGMLWAKSHWLKDDLAKNQLLNIDRRSTPASSSHFFCRYFYICDTWALHGACLSSSWACVSRAERRFKGQEVHSVCDRDSQLPLHFRHAEGSISKHWHSWPWVLYPRTILRQLPGSSLPCAALNPF